MQSELDGERWTEEFHVMIAEELGVHERGGWILRHVVEQSFPFAGRGKGDEEPSGSTADAGPDVRNAARAEG